MTITHSKLKIITDKSPSSEPRPQPNSFLVHAARRAYLPPCHVSRPGSVKNSHGPVWGRWYRMFFSAHRFGGIASRSVFGLVESGSKPGHARCRATPKTQSADPTPDPWPQTVEQGDSTGIGDNGNFR